MKFKKTTLKNGLRVITVPMQETQTVTVLIMVGVGSRYEKETEAGISHFIEHMFFKGTLKRPTALQISEELDSIGGEFNAFTSKEVTGYYAKVDAKHIDTAIDVVSDIYLNSKIEEDEIKKEKGTILQELNMYEDLPMRSVADVFEELLYPNNNLGRGIVGYKKTIKNFKRKDFFKYIKKFYVANDTVIAVAGKFDEKNILENIEKIFISMPEGKKAKISRVTEKQKKVQLKVKTKKTDQTHLVLGARAYDDNHRDRYVLSVLAIILGGGMSSRMFMEIREKRGLAYYVRTSTESFEDVGYLATSAGVEHKNLKLAIKTIIAEYEKIRNEKVSEKELQKAKDFIKGKTVMSMESSDEVAMFFLGQEISNKKILTLEEKFALIDKVTAEDVLRVAKDIFQESKINLAVIGPHKKTRELEAALKLK